MGDISRAYAAYLSDSSTRNDLEATLVKFVRNHDTKPYSGKLSDRTQVIESILNMVNRASQSEFGTL